MNEFTTLSEAQDAGAALEGALQRQMAAQFAGVSDPRGVRAMLWGPRLRLATLGSTGAPIT